MNKENVHKDSNEKGRKSKNKRSRDIVDENCIVCGQLIEDENEYTNKIDEFQSLFLYNKKLCRRCKGPFKTKKDKLEKLSIPILVSLILNASIKHVDVNNMVNRALFGKSKTSIQSALNTPTPSKILVINDEDSIIINSKKNIDPKDSVTGVLTRKLYEYNKKKSVNIIHRTAIHLTPSGRKPRTGPLGSYEDMIVQALISIGDKNGSKPKDIFDWMEQNCIGIPEAFRASASQALKKANCKGKIKKVGNSLYKVNKEYDYANDAKKRKRPGKLDETYIPESVKNIIAEKQYQINYKKFMTKNRTEETSPNNEDESNVKRNRSSSLPYIYSDEETVGSNNLSNAESIIPTQIADSLTLIPNTSKENIPRVDPLSSTQPDPSKIPSELLNTSSSLLNSISSFNPLENEPTDQTTLININSINEKNKGIYNQIIQQSPSFISPDLFLLSGDAPSSSNASLIKASHQTKTEIDHNKPPPPIIDSNLFTPSDGGLPLFTPNYLDPQLQYLMSQTSQALSSNIMEYLDTSNPNTINPLTDLSNTTHTLPSQPHPTSLETAFNYDIINNMLWPQDTS